MTQSSANDNAKVRGWKDISTTLEVSERTARDLELHAKHPLRVDKDQKGVFVRADYLARWQMEHETMLSDERKAKREERVARREQMARTG